MVSESEPEIILYDLACTKRVCSSTVVRRIRLVLDYKRIPCETILLELPDIEPRLKKLSVIPLTLLDYGSIALNARSRVEHL